MKIFLSVIIIFMVGLCAMVFGIEQFGGYPELGTVVEIAVASGFIIYFQGQSKKKKNGQWAPLYKVVPTDRFFLYLQNLRNVVNLSFSISDNKSKKWAKQLKSATACKSTFILTPQRGGGVKVLLRYFLTEKVTKRCCPLAGTMVRWEQ